MTEPSGADTWSAALGPRIRQLRRQRGLTIAELARQAGMHEVSVSRVERGVVLPSATSLHAIAGALGIEAESLYGMKQVVTQLTQVRPVQPTPRAAPWMETVTRGQGDRPRVPLPGWGVELLSSGPHRLLQSSIHSYEPGLEVWHQDWDGDEWGLVLEGGFEFVTSGQSFQVDEGDSFYWSSPPELLIRAIGTTPGRILFVYARTADAEG